VTPSIGARPKIGWGRVLQKDGIGNDRESIIYRLSYSVLELGQKIAEKEGNPF
jgi:hypothetical protein